MKTRDRILFEARLLFNARGYGNVPTAELAEHLGMSEGNLWYHFKSKRALLEALSAQFADEIEARLAIEPTPGDDIVEGYADLLGLLMAELRRNRFLYRDQADYGEHCDVVLLNLPGWYARTGQQLLGYYRVMVEQRLLDWPAGRLPDLTTNATIILRFGLEYRREIGEDMAAGAGSVRRALLQHLTLFEGKLEADAAMRLHRAIAALHEPILAVPNRG